MTQTDPTDDPAAEAETAAAYSRALATPPSAEAGAYIRDRLAQRAPAPAVVSPPTDRAARVAAALREHGMVHLGDQVPADEYDCCADAVLAVLPEQADRAAVLLDAADRLIGLRDSLITDPEITGRFLAGLERGASELRRLAAEAHSAGTQQQEARPPEHAWRVETRDGEWVRGSHFLNRQAAVERYETANNTAPLWQDGTPIERRIVRETTTYTVEEPAAEQQQPAAVPQRAYPDCERCGDTGIDPEQDDAPCPACQQPAAADDEETHRG